MEVNGGDSSQTADDRNAFVARGRWVEEGRLERYTCFQLLVSFDSRMIVDEGEFLDQPWFGLLPRPFSNSIKLVRTEGAKCGVCMRLVVSVLSKVIWREKGLRLNVLMQWALIASIGW